MNISLAPKAKKKKKKAQPSIGFGLNSRNPSAAAAAANVFGGDDSSDEEDGATKANTNTSNRARVNQQIAKEQAALRKRAQAAVANLSAGAANELYDYDGAYESFRPQDTPGAASASQEPERKSRYIGDLLQAAKKRDREREAIHERKVAKEQAEEDAQEDYVGKEKFITKAYRRKLEERKQWEADEEARDREETADDVTKKSAGSAMASFYGNMSKNVAMGGSSGNADEKKNSASDLKDDQDDNDAVVPKDSSPGGALGFLAGFERADEPSPSDPNDNRHEVSGLYDKDEGAKDQTPASLVKELTMREKREKKVAEARIRYLERKQLALQ